MLILSRVSRFVNSNDGGHSKTLAAFTAFLLAVSFAGCATTKTPPITSLKEAKAPVWSAKAVPGEMIVSVSPAGKSLRIVGSAGIVLGAGADAVVNAQYRKPIHDALEGYDTTAVFKESIAKRLAEALPQGISETAPLGSTAGVSSKTDAEKLRYESLMKKGSDAALDFVLTYGIYGPEGILAARIGGKAIVLETGKRLWMDTLVVTTEPVLANAKLGDPTNRLGMNVTDPDFTVDSEKVSRWTADGGAELKKRFETAVNGASAALLCDLGLSQDAVGEYYLGKLRLNQKKFKQAGEHFRKAVELDPSYVDARNAHAVTLALHGQLDDAIASARGIVDATPDYGPAWFNLAYWYAVKKKDAASAGPCYEKAKALGMASDRRIEKSLKK
ncbi:MAG: tetratricopeptide repeat protein [Candidatus Hydrogenedentes bacterium]|nr:tetratricopeptide repeat protein [Candidatus Hydrogenedentota bacterium]